MFDQWSNRLHRMVHDPVQVDPFLMQMDSPRSDAGHFQQIIYQSGHLSDLAFDDRAGRMLKLVFVPLETKKLHCVGNRGERMLLA